MNPKDLPAFPVIGHSRGGDEAGMTLLDYFASKAMQALITKDNSASLVATQAYEQALAMLKERENHAK